jgi:hypothetical protein
VLIPLRLHEFADFANYQLPEIGLLDHYRQQTIASARGLVLEVGVGSG